ncbi:S8 family serine peptidase [Symbioplanes lichenis]|uniref:S8 family serine peptidase n=1 Tax=Symbioplanes lichenis TaxID=1629072 RepID=UPI0027394788|nr:S8 family serine peptidase [Actinoplanes lichenis]
MIGSRLAACVASVLVLTAAPVQGAEPAWAADGVRAAQWHLAAVDAGKAHRISLGAGVTVALVDTGVEAGHDDLAGAVLPGVDLFPDPLGDGRDDIDGHGTEMAGIIAGRGHGGRTGVLGIAPAAMILPIRGPIKNMATSEFLTRAVAFARERGAGVVNMSFGTGDTDVLRAAVRAAVAADMVVVAASGNVGSGAGEFPGRYPEVVTVGAVGRTGKVAHFSVTGPQVDLTAPGVDIVTTGIGRTGYYRGSGTSEATAVVSGAAALVRAAYPELNAAEVVRRLTVTAADAGRPGRDDTYGFGRLDLVRALTADVPRLDRQKPQIATVRPTAETAAGPAPKRVPPLVVTGIAAAAVVLAGAVIVVVMLARRRD